MKHFFPFRFDEAERALWRGAEPVRLTPKAADLLLCLLERAGTVLSPVELLSLVWGDTHVQPDNVKVVVRELRQALDDDPQAPRYISSIRGRGYRFLVVPEPGSPVMDVDEAGAHQAEGVVRSDELGVLHAAFTAAERDACRHLVIVEGGRGFGKTTLVESFARTIGGRARIARGKAVETQGPDSPLWPLIDAIDDLMRQSPGMIRPLLQAHAPSWLARLTSSDGREPLPRDRGAGVLAAELSSALEAITKSAPLILMLEDLQWSDRETITTLHGMLSRNLAARLLVILTYTPTPTLTHRFPRELAGDFLSMHTNVVRLQPFTRDAIEMYLGARFGEACAPALAPVVAPVAMGHPFLLSMLLEGLIAMQCLRREGDEWRVSDRGELTRAVQAATPSAHAWHIDQLDIEDRNVLEAAAAVGSHFSAASVATALGTTAVESVAHLLSTLGTGGVLCRPTSGRLQPSFEYEFYHVSYADALLKAAPPFERLRMAERLQRRSRLKRHG